MDAVAGGGGIITLPAYLFAGVPIHVAYGTNKFGNSFGTAIATFNYGRGGFVRWKPGFLCAVFSLIGSWLGARLVVALSAQALQYCTMLLLPAVAIFMVMNRNIGKEEKEELTGKKLYWRSALIGFAVGAYDGFFGPGTGTFLLLALSVFCGFDLLTASGNTKLMNLSSNVAAFTAFALGGKTVWAVGLTAAAFGMLGNYVGSGLALKNGAKVIRPMLLLVLALLVGRLAWELAA